MLPNLVIIGAMKCGTTSLHSYLSLHPEIKMSRQKELDFFINKYNWHRGIDWYQSHFQGKAKIYGESSPNYSNYPSTSEVVPRMYDLIPQAKLIYLVRDPIVRMISHYVHKYSAGLENLPIQEALLDPSRPFYLYRSLYYLQLQQFLAYYQPSQILVLASEDLRQQTASTLRRVYEFLEVDTNFQTWGSKIQRHSSTRKRRKTELGNWLTNTPPIKLLNQLPQYLRWPIEEFIYYFFSRPVDPPQISEALRQEIKDRLREDTQKLREFTGCDFKQWSI